MYATAHNVTDRHDRIALVQVVIAEHGRQPRGESRSQIWAKENLRPGHTDSDDTRDAVVCQRNRLIGLFLAVEQ
jgi:hypothetical protein